MNALQAETSPYLRQHADNPVHWQPWGPNALQTAAQANKHIAIDNISSIATSLGAKKVAKRAFELLREQPIITHVVSDDDALIGCHRFLADHRLMVEPACGANLSAVYNGCVPLQDKRNILLIVCGGVGVTLTQLTEWSRRLS